MVFGGSRNVYTTLEELPEHLRVDAASAVYVESRLHATDATPWAVVFDDEVPAQVAAKLFRTCLSLDGQAPLQNPDLRLTIDAISSTFKSKGIEAGAATTKHLQTALAI